MSECAKCKFFSPSINWSGDRGLCRATLPSIGVAEFGGIGYGGEWPVVRSTDWCGEFKRKRETP